MMKYLLGIFGVSLLALCMFAGCGAKKQETADTPPESAKTTEEADAQAKPDEPKADEQAKDEPKADGQAKDEPKADEQAKDSEPDKAKPEIPAPKRLHVSDIKSFVERVHVDGVDGIKEPNLKDDGNGIDPEYPAMANHNNGETEDDHSRWVETKGVYAGIAKEFYDSLTSPDKLGPTSLTKNLTIEDMKTSDDGTTFILHVGKGDGFEDAYDMGVTIDTVYDKQDKLVGWRYHGQKIAGSKNVEKAEQDILIYQLDARHCYIEYRNVLKGALFNDENMVTDRGQLEDYWSNISHTYADSLLE